MKPLFSIVVAILVLTANAHPENIEEVKELPQTKEPLLEAEETAPQARIGRCTTCTGNLQFKSPLAALQQLPGGEVHTQQSFEGCSSDKGCAGLKVKDGRVIEKFGNVDAFQAAAAQNAGGEFTFHPAGNLGNLLEGGLNGEGGPYWWMNQQNSPFKNAAGAGGFEKFSKSSSSSFSTGNAGAAGIDIAANPFLNGDFSKLSGGFSGGAGFTSGAANAQENKPGYQSSSFESSSFSSSSKGDIDLTKNPFLNGGVNKFGQSGFQAQGNFGAGQSQFGASAGQNQFGAGSSQGQFGAGAGQSQFGAGSSQSQFAAGAGQSQFGAGTGQGQFGAGQGGQSGFGAQNSQNFNQASFGSSSKFGTSGSSGYTGSSPSPFTASTAGSNVNLIQNTQKASEFDFEQQQQTQQNVDEAFQHTGNVNAHEHSGGDLQQTCAGNGYVCVHKAQCNNGVVNTNGGGLLQANTQKQYCNVRTEICCRIETASLAGAGSLQGSLGVGSATFSGSSNQGAGLFATSNQNSAGQASGSSGTYNGQASGFNGQSANGFNSAGTSGSGFNSGSFNQNSGSSTGFGSSFNKATTTGFGSQGTFGAGNTNSFGSDAGNRGVSVQSSSSSFEASRGNKFGGYGGSTVAPSTNKFGANNFNNEVYKSTSQSNFIETDSFSAGSEQAGVYRPGAIGSGLKPGIPYLPPVDSSTSASNSISSTAFVTSPRPRPTTVRPFTTPRPFVPSTSAPGYLPPVGESSINTETRLPPNPVYTDGQIILDETRQPTRRPVTFTPGPAPNEVPSGCAAALKCTPIEFCTAEGVISNTTVVLTRDQDAYRVPLTDCKDVESGRIGKCCRDPFYTDPWPTNQLGKWVPGVFGGNDGKYVPDSKGAPSTNIRPSVTVRPPVTGSVYLNNFRTTKPTVGPTFGPNQVTPGFPTATPGSFIQKGQGQYDVRGQGSYSTAGKGQVGIGGQGQFGVAGLGQNSQGSQFGQGSQFTQTTSSSYGQSTRGQGQTVTQGEGQGVIQGAGQSVTQGQGIYSQGGRGQYDSQGQAGQNTYTQTQGFNQGQGLAVSQGQGSGVIKGSGQTVSQGFGQSISQSGSQSVTQGQGIGVIRGSGQSVTTGQGFATQQGQGQGAYQGQGQSVTQGQGFGISQGSGLSINRGQGQVVSQGQGFGITQGQSTFGQGSSVSQGSGLGVSQGFGTGIIQGGGIGVTRGQGQFVSQGQGQSVGQGGGFGVTQGQGQQVTQGQRFGLVQGQGQSVSQSGGFGITQGGGSYSQGGVGFGVIQGQGQKLIQGGGSGEIRGEGFQVTQGGGVGVENEYSESVRRVFLSRYSGGGQCGVVNPTKPYGNRADLEADFSEIPWQAMVLLQTNRSLLCGGVITRPDVVVTSASCVDGLDAKNVLIKGGEWKLGIDDEPLPFQIVQVKTILRHPFYQRGSLKYDAAILVLNENLRLANNIYPICLPEAKEETLDAYYNGAGECIVTGWGKTVLQAHLKGSIMHSLNVSLINPGECQAKLQSDYPHLLEQYDEESCACGQPTNPTNNICKVDIGSALACTSGDGHYIFRGVYSWDSGCQVGNQIAGFWKFDLEWYQWAIGLIESVRFAKYTTGSKVTQNKYTSQINTSGVKTTQFGVKGSVTGVKEVSGAKELNSFAQGLSQGQFGFGSSKYTQSSGGGLNLGSQIKAPISNTFSATYTEKKVFQSEPKFVTYTTKPEIVTFTTKPEYFTYTTKPKIVTYTTKPEIVTFTTKPEIVTYTTKPEIFTYTTKPKIVSYTTKPQIIRYETSGSGTNPQYVAPGVTFNPSFSEVVGHKHTAACKCLEGKK